MPKENKADHLVKQEYTFLMNYSIVINNVIVVIEVIIKVVTTECIQEANYSCKRRRCLPPSFISQGELSPALNSHTTKTTSRITHRVYRVLASVTIP